MKPPHRTLCAFSLKSKGYITVLVEIVRELPTRFGRRDFVVTPVGGSGEVTVNASKLHELPPKIGTPA